MRVAFLAVDIDLAGFTGDVSHVQDLAIALAREGCDLDLFVANPADWAAPDRIRVHRTARRGTFRTALTLRRTLRSNPPSVIYERRGSPKLAFVLSILLGTPYFVEINGLVDEEKSMQGHPGNDPRWVRAIRLWVRGRMLRRARGIIAVTTGIKQNLVSRHMIPSRKVEVVPNGVDTDFFRPTSKDEARLKLGLSLSGSYVVFVGNLVAWQGVDVVLRALPVVSEAIPSIRFLIVGDGRQRKALETLTVELGVRDSVMFVGWVPREQVPLWISAADVAVMPKTRRLNEQAGSSALKLREYLACGRPVLASNIEGGGPFLEHHGVGVGFACDDSADLASGIVHMFQDPARLELQGHRGRRLAIAELTWTRAARQILAVFRGKAVGDEHESVSPSPILRRD
jgi:glycosyltransferase involved in cell wall biosynthesis